MKSISVATAATVLLNAAGVLGHGYVSSAVIGGTTYTGYLPYSDPYYATPPQRIFRKIAGNGPVEDITSVDLQCGGYQNSGSAPAPLSASVAAGSTISLTWTTWPDSHKGPVSTYMAKCPSTCTGYSPGTAAVWFKVAHAGKNSDGSWASVCFHTPAIGWYTTLICISQTIGPFHHQHAVHLQGAQYPCSG